MTQDLDLLMAELQRLPDARVGQGSRPGAPGAGDRLEQFLEDVPAMARDADYVDFLRRYSGAYIEDGEANHIVDLFGFSDVGTDLVEMVAPVEPDQPFVVFAQCIYHKVDADGQPDVDEYSFAFPNDPGVSPGVFELLETVAGAQGPWRRQSDSFTDWLAELVRRRGWWGTDRSPMRG